MKGFKVILAAALLMALALVGVPTAGAQLNITWTTGFQVQNLSATAANVSITFYDGTTGNALTPFNAVIGANASTNFFPLDGGAGRPSVPAGFSGSAVISSDQPVSAILNILGNGTAYGGSASGISAGSTTVGLPLIQKNNGGFQTWFSLQNAGSANATVSVAFKPRDSASGNAFTVSNLTIKPGAALTLDTTTPQLAGLVSSPSGKFVGSATVTSNQPIAAIVNQTGLGASKTLLTYDGFGSSAGSTTINMPLIQNGNAGFFSGLSIQNLGGTPTTITVTYGPNTKGTFQPQNQTFTNVAAGSTIAFNTAAAFGGNTTAQRFVGSAKVTATNPLVGVVNQLGAISGSSYEAFNPSLATNKVSAPLIMANNGGFLTSIQCQNLGNAATTITVDFSPNTKGTFQLPNVTQTIQPGVSGAPINQGAAAAGNRYVGSATVTATGNVPIACVINELGAATGDTLLTYPGTNQ
jgi:hypothetical protein